MTDENTAPENREAPLIPPPKLFEQLAMMQAGGVRSPQPEPPKRKLKVSTLLWILIVISAGILAFVFFGGPMKKADDGRDGNCGTGSSSAPAVPMKPRVSIPVPTDAEIDASPVPPIGSDLLAELDKKLTAEISAGEGGLKPLIGKASLSLLDSKYGLTDEDLKGQNPDAKVLASTYQDMFKRMGEQLGKDGNVLADIDFLAAEQGRLLGSLEDWQGLQITKVVLCQRVSGFGRYEAFNENEFVKGSTPLILVYTELVNFKTRAEDDGRFMVRLKEELSIEAADGRSEGSLERARGFGHGRGVEPPPRLLHRPVPEPAEDDRARKVQPPGQDHRRVRRQDRRLRRPADNHGGVAQSDKHLLLGENQCAVAHLLRMRDTVLVEDDPYRELRFEGEDLLPVHRHPDQPFDIERHIAVLRRAYRQQRDRMLHWIRTLFPESTRYTCPQGGMFIWVTLFTLTDAAHRGNVFNL